MSKKIIILGAGLVGGPMGIDLSRDREFSVAVADISSGSLDRLSKYEDIEKIQVDLSDRTILPGLVRDYDLVMNAVPGFMGFETLRNIIAAGKNVVDIAFYPEDMFLLDNLAREKDVIGICDMGVAPGMSHLLVGYANSLLDRINSIKIFVGGLPKERTPPWEYKAVFSPADVIEEYIRPARLIREGKMVEVEALSEPEMIDFDDPGPLEAFNSDGLRSLVKTIDAQEMVEKTLRYPGHIDKIRVLRDTGFFSKEKIKVGSKEMVPLELTRELLFPLWKLESGEADLTVMRVIVEGLQDKIKTIYQWDLYDEFDPSTGIHSMARTTGYAATMAARMVLSGMYNYKGISPPEYIGQHPDCVTFMLEGLKKRGVEYRLSATHNE